MKRRDSKERAMLFSVTPRKGRGVREMSPIPAVC